MAQQNNKEVPPIYGPAKGTKYLSESTDKDTLHAISTVLSKLADQFSTIGPVDISFGHLEPPISDEDKRAQVTVEFYDYNKQDLVNISRTKEKLTERANTKKNPEIIKEQVNRLQISLPKGKDQDDLEKLLKTASVELKNLGNINVVDLTLYASVQSGLDRPSLVVYYKQSN